MFGAYGWAIELDETAPFQDAVDDGLSQIRVVQHGSPVGKSFVGGQQDGPLALMPLVDDVEEHVGGVNAVGKIPQLIDDQDMRVGVGLEPFPERALVSGS